MANDAAKRETSAGSWFIQILFVFCFVWTKMLDNRICLHTRRMGTGIGVGGGGVLKNVRKNLIGRNQFVRDRSNDQVDNIYLLFI